jgi:DNA helicase-2/ATP-dependent DNA helicase PcrA
MFDGLNPSQREAVETLNGPLLVIAGAGSGKTRVVTMRIANLLQSGVPSSKILGLTFTNKAAGEMKERVRSLTNSDVLISTFHSLGARILRESIEVLGYNRHFIIYDEEDVDKLLKTCIEEVMGQCAKGEVKTARSMISTAKNQLINPDVADQLSKDPNSNRNFPTIYAKYQRKLLECNAVDFDDLLFLTVRLFREHTHVLNYYQERWSHLLIDEYQDTNQVQYEIVNLLVSKSQNLCVVGDPDQSIYSWRGANIRNIMCFEQDYPGAKVVSLDRNYRSSNNILNAANALISCNYSRYEKKLWSDLGDGEKLSLYTADTERHEALFIVNKISDYHRDFDIPLNQMVVFYRTNAQSRALEDYFLHRRIPYVVVGGISFYQRREIKDVLALLRMAQSGADFIAFDRTINIPKRGLGDSTIDKIRLGASAEGMPILSFCSHLISGGELKTPIKLSAKQKEGLQDYLKVILAIREVAETASISSVVRAAIEQSRYLKYLEEDKETFQDRKENLGALISKAAEWEGNSETPSLESFLEELSLRSSADDAETSNDRVNLMTLHNGKGLEFTVTFLAGMEEDLLPHVNSRDNSDAQEEERRLCYVGITRAKKHLFLTYCRSRQLWGVTRFQKPSRFLYEIPREYMQKI